MSDAPPATVQDPAGRLRSLWRQGRRPDAAEFLAAAGPLTPDQVVAVLRVDQCLRWEAGERVPAEAYLGMHPALAADAEKALELIYGEWLLREERGDSAEEEFFRRFPQHADRLRRQIELHRALEVRETTPQSRPGPPPPRPPRTLGRYRIIKVLGQGGMGTVYHAHDEHLERPVALKVMRFGAEDAAQVERFFREARIAASFTHPHLCPVYDFAQADGVHYLTMPLIAGEPLSERLRREGPMPGPEAARLTALVARAVHEAHRAGVLHRDLKPGNVMLNERREPVVMDFGLARRFGPLDPRITRPGMILGTPAYMAPEQVRGGSDAGGPTQDVYSLGVMLYEMLTGRLPFESSAGDVLDQILAGAPVPPSRLRPGLDERLERVCLKAMARDPAARFPTMAAFAEALEAYAKEQERPTPPAAPKPTQKTTPRPGPSRRLVWLAGALLGATALAVVAVAGFALSRHGPPLEQIHLSSGGGDHSTVAPASTDEPSPPGGAEADGFSAGSKWEGTFDRPDDHYARPVTLEIEERAGERFQGTYTADKGEYVWKVEGTIRGDEVRWEFTKKVFQTDARAVVGTASVAGTLTGGRVFDGRFENRSDGDVARIKLLREPK